MKIFQILRSKWFKFFIWTILYLLWVIWFGKWWLIIGIAVIFDVFITKKVKWAFWKKRYKEGEQKIFWLEWLDAIIFAIVVVTFLNVYFFASYMIPTGSMERTLMTGDRLFVNKLSYGPRIAHTPLTLPLTQNVIPVIGGESYLEWIKAPYRRLAGLSKVKRDDIVVFNFPHGDTVLSKIPTEDYYTWTRMYDRKYLVDTYGPLIVRPYDKTDNYVKRCVAIAGDTMQIIDGVVYINGTTQLFYEGRQNTYTVVTNGNQINPKILSDMGYGRNSIFYDSSIPGYPAMPLNDKEVMQISNMAIVTDVIPNIENYSDDPTRLTLSIFPFSEDFQWSRDNYGPLWVPKSGATVELTLQNLPLYRRIITVYEGNELAVKDDIIYINGVESREYTFKWDYYFMMGDNRHNSLDSRYWGFVPETHIIGTPLVVWFSSDLGGSFPGNIRWSRFLKFV